VQRREWQAGDDGRRRENRDADKHIQTSEHGRIMCVRLKTVKYETRTTRTIGCEDDYFRGRPVLSGRSDGCSANSFKRRLSFS
jgi:hypothetical protein